MFTPLISIQTRSISTLTALGSTGWCNLILPSYKCHQLWPPWSFTKRCSQTGLRNVITLNVIAVRNLAKHYLVKITSTVYAIQWMKDSQSTTDSHCFVRNDVYTCENTKRFQEQRNGWIYNCDTKILSPQQAIETQQSKTSKWIPTKEKRTPC
jgi:hypothetical protein